MAVGERQQLIKDEDMVWIQISLALVIRACSSLVGVVINVFNMVVFFKIGLRDSMSVGLFLLSMTDVLQSLIQLTSCTCYAVDVMFPNDSIDIRALGNNVIGWTVNAIYRISCWVTAMVSLERCLCVVSPFKVKDIFTRCRCTLVIFIIYLVHIGMYVPVFVSHRMEWSKHPLAIGGFNITLAFIDIFTVILNEDTANVEFIFDVTLGITWLILSHIVVIVCALLLNHSLKASSRFRQAPKTSDKDGHTETGVSQLTNREKRLVKIVLLLAVILTACNIPKYVVFTVYHTLPGMNIGGQRNLTALLWNIVPIIANIGCSVNFIVYFKLNSKFRQTVRQCLGADAGRQPGRA